MFLNAFPYNRFALLIVALFVASLFHELIHLPAEGIFTYPDLNLTNERSGKALVIVSALYGLLLGTGFYRWQTRLTGIIAIGLWVRQLWLLFEAIQAASDNYQFRIADIGELVRYLNRDPVTQFTDTAGMLIVGLLTLLFCATLIIPYAQNPRLR